MARMPPPCYEASKRFGTRTSSGVDPILFPGHQARDSSQSDVF
jgi:hypothetical protein